jgi:hypothetical protein
MGDHARRRRGGYPGSPYFKITVAGTDRALAATAEAELTVLPAFTGGPEQLWRVDQLTDGTYRLMPKGCRVERRDGALGGGQQHADARGLQAGGRSGALADQDAMTATAQESSMTRLRNALVSAIVSAIGALPFAVVVIVAATGQQPAPAPAPATGPPTAPTAPTTPNAPRGPAPSLARPASPTKASDRAGFLQRWLILEPLKVPGQLTEGAVQALVKKEHVPESLTAVPKDGEVVHAGDETLSWHAVDTTAYNVNLFHFAYALNKPTSNVLFWAVTVVDAPREMPGVRLAIGSNAASVVVAERAGSDRPLQRSTGRDRRRRLAAPDAEEGPERHPRGHRERRRRDRLLRPVPRWQRRADRRPRRAARRGRRRHAAALAAGRPLTGPVT